MPVSNPASTSYIQGLFHNQQAKKDAARQQQAREAAAGASCNRLTEALSCLSRCCELADHLVVASVSGWDAQPLPSVELLSEPLRYGLVPRLPPSSLCCTVQLFTHPEMQRHQRALLLWPGSLTAGQPPRQYCSVRSCWLSGCRRSLPTRPRCSQRQPGCRHSPACAGCRCAGADCPAGRGAGRGCQGAGGAPEGGTPEAAAGAGSGAPGGRAGSVGATEGGGNMVLTGTCSCLLLSAARWRGSRQHRGARMVKGTVCSVCV